MRPPGNPAGIHPDGKQSRNSKGKSSCGQPSLNAANLTRTHWGAKLRQEQVLRCYRARGIRGGLRLHLAWFVKRDEGSHIEFNIRSAATSAVFPNSVRG